MGSKKRMFFVLIPILALITRREKESRALFTFLGSTTPLTLSTIFNNKWPELLEIYLYNGTFGIRLDARDILKRR